MRWKSCWDWRSPPWVYAGGGIGWEVEEEGVGFGASRPPCVDWEEDWEDEEGLEE